MGPLRGELTPSRLDPFDEYLPAAPGFFLDFPERAKEQPKIQALLAAVRACRVK